MKNTRLLVLGAVLLLPYPAFSRIVRGAEALRAAESILRQDNAHKQLRTRKDELSILRFSVLTRDTEPVGYLAELNPRGFMILSDITELAPVRFRCYDAQFEDLREHSLIGGIMRDSLATKQRLGYSRPIAPSSTSREALSAGFDAGQLFHNEQLWSQYTRIAASAAFEAGEAIPSVSPLLTSRWAQTSPFNLNTPVLPAGSGNPSHTLAGCSAVAQAQIMYYWKYPSRGQDGKSYYWQTGGRNLPANFDHSYDWSSMADIYDGSEADRQKNAVAALIADVGYSINMDYGLGLSMAVPNFSNSLVNFFNYSRGVMTARRSDYRDATGWFNTLKEQMDKGWPAMLLVDSSTPPTHTVVVDGYRMDGGNQVHLNMGWGGSSDAYYSLDSILNYDLVDSQYAIVNIHPPSLSIFFPHVALGGGYRTVFTLGNTGSDTVSGTLTLTDQGGKPLTVSATVNNPGVETQQVSASSFPVSIPAGGGHSLPQHRQSRTVRRTRVGRVWTVTAGSMAYRHSNTSLRVSWRARLEYCPLSRPEARRFRSSMT